jgi:SAM-dependent methyltransferase
MGQGVRGAVRLAVRTVRPALSLETRKRLVNWVDSRRLPGHYTFSTEMLHDLQRSDPNAFHRFLWSNHLAYATTYEIARRFGSAQIEPTRHTLFADILAHLRARGHDPAADVRSVFDVGCSLGYLLRHAETDLFPAATILRGLDIDRYAVQAGRAHLRSLGSRVELTAADMTEADRVMGGQAYDVVLCCGVLMYLDEIRAAQVVKTLIAHTRFVTALIGLANPDMDNSRLERSEVRPSDGAFIHNLHRMLQDAGGKVVSSRWARAQGAGGSPAYSVLAERT